jgi:hypothetical protein
VTTTRTVLLTKEFVVSREAFLVRWALDAFEDPLDGQRLICWLLLCVSMGLATVLESEHCFMISVMKLGHERQDRVYDHDGS